MIYSIVNLKGGCGKTTTATYLTAGLYERDGSATEIDSDDQGSALSWAEQIEPPWLTVSMPTRTIHHQVDHLLANTKNLVIDTPPKGRPIIVSAIQAAARHDGVIIVPVQPTTADIDKLFETIDLIDDAAAGGTVRTVILLTRAVKGTRALRESREALVDQGLDVLTAVVHQSQALAMAHGHPITDLGDYADVLAELTEKVAV